MKKILKYIRNAILTVVAVYVLTLVYLVVCQRSMIYPAGDAAPLLSEADLPGFSVVKYSTTDGLTLTAWYGAAVKGKPTVMLFHGNAGALAQRADFARFLLQQGYGVMLTSYRGYPPNDGSPSEDGLYEDARAALNFLNKEKIGNDDIVVFGASLGSGPATELALEMAKDGKPARTLFLEVPFTSLIAPAQKKYPYMPVETLLFDKYDNLSKIAAIQTSVCIVAAGNDAVVPTDHARELYAAATGPRYIYIVDGAAHNQVLKDSEANFRLAYRCIERKAK